ncbi:MAG: hypothetical protein ACKV2T_38450 [Kofleriaceae bacterium]
MRSQFLLDVKAQLKLGRRGWPNKGLLEFTEESNDSMLRESLEILQDVTRRELRVYQTLTIWGDQVATYSVRETVGKRMYKLVVRVREFPLISTPERIAEAYWWSSDQLVELGVPPGKTQKDRELLERISQRWLELASEDAH